MSSSQVSLPYHEPGIVIVLVQSSFLLVLNIFNHLLNNLLYCGLLGQILIGVAWGTPGGKWLGAEAEEIIVQLGYLGLTLLVFEGGLSTSFSSLKANLLRSAVVASTGIALPIALSFVLQGLVDATSLQAFAAGAALCSTSLGTTFTVLETSGLSHTRLGVVLTSAAMMDDVVGLVMVEVISNLGEASSSFSAATVVRPVFVSIGFAAFLPIVCIFVVKPATRFIDEHRTSHSAGMAQRALKRQDVACLIHTGILLALVTAASYAGTSNLFAAYLAGASISWWDSELPHMEHSIQSSAASAATANNETPVENQESSRAARSSPGGNNMAERAQTPSQETDSKDLSGAAVYDTYYKQPVERILKPFFFASIGFSIPISRMFTGSAVWRGIVFTILMVFAKLACGLWLVPLNSLFHVPTRLTSLLKDDRFRMAHFQKTGHTSQQKQTSAPVPAASSEEQEQISLQARTSDKGRARSGGLDVISPEAGERDSPAPNAKPPAPVTQPNDTSPMSHLSKDLKKPLSLYPASILGCAMVSRGEIGFLISSVAQSNGIFDSAANGNGDADAISTIFLVVTWGIFLCTIIGPLTVGLLVRRVKRLSEKSRSVGARDALGVWGVE